MAGLIFLGFNLGRPHLTAYFLRHYLDHSCTRDLSILVIHGFVTTSD
jgi:hypothetical protein